MKKEFSVRSIRRLTADGQHNAFTGAAWFRGMLYVAFRQGDRHVCDQGRLIAMRSRDEGAHFDTVAVVRGEFDTRDAHLYTDGDRRLYLAGIEDSPGGDSYSGAAWSDDGLHWSAWKRCEGADRYVMWRPRCLDGRFFCAGYRVHQASKSGKTGNVEFTASDVAWFESADGVRWDKRQTIHEGQDRPNECYFDFRTDGSVVLLMRREHDARTPLLCRSAPPYQSWEKVELDIPLHGPALWLVDDDIWISGRWFLNPYVTHQGVFKVVDSKAELQLVLPSGPGAEVSYMGVARHPLNKRRFALSYYSSHTAGDDPAVCQWDHPDIYLVDMSFTAEFLSEWEVSDVLVGGALPSATAEMARGWKTLKAYGEEERLRTFFAYGFVDATARIAGRSGVIFFRKTVEVGPIEAGLLHLGFDGPVRVRLNGKAVYEGPGTNPAVVDQVTVPVWFRHGSNDLEIALDTHDGRACGIFARYEAAGGRNEPALKPDALRPAGRPAPTTERQAP